MRVKNVYDGWMWLSEAVCPAHQADGPGQGWRIGLQDVTNRMLCDSSTRHAIGWGLQVSLRPTAAAASASELLAAQLHSAFRGSVPLNIHSMCYGSLRIPTHAKHASHMWRPEVKPPDAACMHGLAAPETSACVPLWRLALQRGACPRAGASSEVSSPAPTPFDRSEDDVEFMAKSVDFFKSSCRETFPGFPSGWQADYCARADAVYCVAGGAEVMRLTLVAGPLPRTTAALVVDGDTVAAVALSAREAAEAASSLDAAQTEVMADAIIVMHAGCHNVTVVFEDQLQDAAPAVRLWELCMVRDVTQASSLLRALPCVTATCAVPNVLNVVALNLYWTCVASDYHGCKGIMAQQTHSHQGHM